MPRRRIINPSLPHRPDRRRQRGNVTDAQRQARRGRPGQVEAIAERRVLALEARKAGGSYREIARQLGVDTHTAWADVAAELAAIREQTVERAEELRELELQRFDQMTAGLWPQIQAGSPPAVSAAVRVSERRSKLLGLDEPTAIRTEISGSLSIADQTRLHAEVEELRRWLTFEELQDLAERSNAIFTDALARAKARSFPIPLALPPSSAEPPADSGNGEPPRSDVGVSSPVSRAAGARLLGEPADDGESRTESGEKPTDS